MKKCPCLLIGLQILLGAAYALYGHIIFLFAPFFFPRRILLTLLLVLAAFTYTKVRYPSYVLLSQLEGEAHFSISDLKSHKSPFHKSLLYRGTLDFKAEDGRQFTSLPCSIYMPHSKKHPPANCSYYLFGTLSQISPHHYLFKQVKKKPWIPIANSFSLAEWRYHAKEKIGTFLKERIPNPQSALFLTALAIGEMDERALAFDFSQLGLQHILAISGFHFALLAAFLGFLLRLIFPYKIVALTLLLLLTAYFLFLGASPSILRAYIAISLFLTAKLFDLRTNALNALGLGLIIELLLDPLVITHIGFQLSFLSTLAILLFYPFMNSLISYLLPKRPLRVVSRMNALNQHGYFFSSLMRNALSLNFAVHLTAIPALLYLFHKFPLLSLVYNLFFPFWVSISLFLLLASFLIPPLHILNSGFTAILLNLTSHPPAFLEFYLRCKPFPFYFLFIYYCLFFFLLVKKRHLNQHISKNLH